MIKSNVKRQHQDIFIRHNSRTPTPLTCQHVTHTHTKPHTHTHTHTHNHRWPSDWCSHVKRLTHMQTNTLRHTHTFFEILAPKSMKLYSASSLLATGTHRERDIANCLGEGEGGHGGGFMWKFRTQPVLPSVCVGMCVCGCVCVWVWEGEWGRVCPFSVRLGVGCFQTSMHWNCFSKDDISPIKSVCAHKHTQTHTDTHTHTHWHTHSHTQIHPARYAASAACLPFRDFTFR